MRMGAFLLGGLVGAAAVVYWNRNKSMSFSGFSSQTSDVVGKVVKSATGSTFKSNDKFSDTSSNEPDLGKVDEIINQDPSVKKQVDEILNKSDSTFMTQ